jgi:glycosyltransferase involved in cell wall biosynthesis
VLEKIRVCKVAPGKRISVLDRVRKRFQPQLEIDWYRAVEGRIDELMAGIDCDVVISSSPPEGAHLIGALIKERFNKKWIADLRDLWSEDHYRSFGSLRRAILFREEKKVLGKADNIITVSKGWALDLGKIYGGRVTCIPNGYDEEYFDRISRETDTKFTISYLGKLNASHQDIAPFLEAVGEIIKGAGVSRDRFGVNFYVSGYGKPDITAFASKHDLSGVVKESGPVSLRTAFRIMKNSSLLLLVGWNGLSASGWRPQKLYEYMGSGTPVLLVNGAENKELAEVLAATGCGNTAFGKEDIKNKICGYYEAFISGKRDDGSRDKERLAEYTASRITEKLCRIIG